MRKEYAEEVANKIIEQLEQGTAPWLRPWKPGELRLPYNAATGKEYRGMNTIWLHMQGHSDPRWMTYRQAEAEGAQVKKGSKGTKIVYWKFRDEQEARDAQGNPILDGNGKPKKIQVELERPRSFTAVVFNAEQIDGLPPLEAREVGREPERHARAEAILANSGADIGHVRGNRAYYQPATDKIVLPERDQFEAADAFYATALHELGHWTGHPSRLDRDLSHPFGSEGYAREELRAEIASLMLGERLEIGHDPGQHAAYVGSWIKALQEDPREIFRAAADAEKITGYVMEFEQEREQQQAVALGQEQAVATVDMHYSDHTLHSLIEDHGWEAAQVGGGSVISVKRQFEGVGPTGTTVTPNGERNLHAGYNADQERRRYIAVTLGDTVIGDVDGRDQNPVEVARQINELAERYVDEQRVENGLDPLHGQAQSQEQPHTPTVEAKPAASIMREADGYAIHGLQSPFPQETKPATTSALDTPTVEAEPVTSVTMDQPTAAVFEELGAAGTRITAEWKNESHAKRAERLVDFARSSIADGNPGAAVGAVNDLARLERRNTHLRDFAQVSKQLGELHGPRVAHDPPEKPMSDRTYLAVPFREKDEAKALGAKWDKEAKSWYAPAGVDLAESGLDRWGTDSPRTVAPVAGTRSPEKAFGDAIRDAGLLLDGDAVMDGKIQRVAVDGDKGSERSGAYAGHLQGQLPGGYIENFKTGERINWKFEGKVEGLSDEDRARQNAEAAAERQRRTQTRLEQQERTADAAAALWAEADDATPDNPYCKAKGIDDADEQQSLRVVPDPSEKLDAQGIKIAKTAAEAKELREANPEAWVFKKGDLLIPGRDMDGKIHTLQAVNPYFKGFMKGSRKHGVFTIAGDRGEAYDYAEGVLSGDKPFVVAEGYATANTVSKHLDQPVIVAFDSGNLDAVVGGLRERFPGTPILIAADNDHAAEKQQGKDGKPRPNVGMEKANAAAEKHAAGVLAPKFADGEKGSDWNDHEKLHGVDATRKHVQEQMAAAKLQAQQNAERLLTLARTREQEARNDPTTSADDTVFAKEQRKVAEMLTMATERLGEVRAEARDAKTADPKVARPAAVVAATTTRTNEQLREQVKTERHEVHNNAVDKKSHEVPWKELPESIRQVKADAIKAGRAVTLPKDAPAALRKAAGLDTDEAGRRSRARARGGIDAGM